MASSDPAYSLYLHVPFCTDKCLYCDFFSVPCRTVSEEVQGAIINQTILQARHLLNALAPGSRVETIFMGGGTPSALVRDDLAALLGAFRDIGCVEWTVEANPESVDRQFLDLCQYAGVTRLSVGVQSLRDERLRLLKRPASRRKTLTALDLLKEKWKGELNLDFIAGIPGQTPGEVREDLSVFAQFQPGHVSLYQLTCEPETELARLVEQGRVVLNSPELDEELWFAGRDELERRGYVHYEISNFCMPGKECRHNLRYWRMEPYVGVGPGAVSTVPAKQFARVLGRPDLAEVPGGVLRVTNTKNLHTFLGGEDTFWGLEVEPVEPKDFLLENLMMGLRLQEGVSMTLWESRFGRSFEEYFPGLWNRWTKQGFAEPPAPFLQMTEAGRLVLDGLLGQIAEKVEAEALPSVVVAWP